jgi:peptide/nickel transport system ATP-binding protein
MSQLLDVQKLRVSYRLPDGKQCPALEGVSFDLQRGEALGVLGESGSGKSTLAAALLKLLPHNAELSGGVVSFDGRDLLRANSAELQRVRGDRIGFIFQEPSLALHPTIRVGEQVRDVISAHQGLTRSQLRAKALETLRMVFANDAARIADSFPHQLSGGQRARVLIAQGIACRPALLIADEPTASLDPETQQGILALLGTLRAELNMALIFITHNPALLKRLADRVLVLYAGRVAEIGAAEKVLSFPLHPYTAALLQSMPPRIAESQASRKEKLPAIPGEAPNLVLINRGCRFEPRCSYRMDACAVQEPGTSITEENHAVACLKYGA